MRKWTSKMESTRKTVNDNGFFFFFCQRRRSTVNSGGQCLSGADVTRVERKNVCVRRVGARGGACRRVGESAHVARELETSGGA